MHKFMRKAMGMAKVLDEFPAPHVEYIENPGQWPNFTRALVARGIRMNRSKRSWARISFVSCGRRSGDFIPTYASEDRP